MQPYRKFRPTGFDVAGLNLEDQQDWLVLSACRRNRDSGLLDESNFECALKELKVVDPEQKDHEVCSFGHWACGWFEIIILRPESKCAEVGQEIEESLSDYPILDESDYSEREYDATCANIYMAGKNMVADNVEKEWQCKVFSWLWENDQSAVENVDDQGGYPTDEEVKEALAALSMLKAEVA